MLNIKKLLSVVAMGVVFANGCEDVQTPPPPPSPARITATMHYTRAFEDGQQIGLQDNDVFGILVASDNRVWIGNQAGIAVYADANATRRTAAFDQNNGLPNPKVRSIVELDGKMYVGTWGGGVGIYDIGADTWRKFSLADGLVDENVSDIQTYNGLLYFATNAGVTLYDPQADTTHSFVPLDPLVSAMEVTQTPRGLEFWYGPRVEYGLEPGTEGDHGITITRGAFDALPDTTYLSPDRDNTMYGDAAGQLSNGAGQRFYSGLGRNGLRRRALVHFDLVAGLPGGARIDKATLRLTANGGLASGSRVDLYRVLANWGEGTSVAPGDESQGTQATSGDATWRYRFYPTELWATAGGDIPLTRTVRLSAVGTSGTYAWTNAAVRSDVNRWHKDPSSNFGWIIFCPDSLKSFASRENATVASRPQLEVIYTRIQFVTTVNSALPAPNVNDIFYDADTDLYWVAFATEGVATVDLNTAKWTFYTTSEGLPSNQTYSIAKHDGVIWVATQNGIARQLGGGSWRGYNSGGGLPADRVRRVYIDPANRMWLSYIQAGAGRVDPNSAE